MNFSKSDVSDHLWEIGESVDLLHMAEAYG